MRDRATICTQICDCRASSLNYGCSLPCCNKGKENRKPLEPFPCTSFLRFLGIGQSLLWSPHRTSIGAIHWRSQSGVAVGGKWGVMDHRCRKCCSRPPTPHPPSVTQFVCVAAHLHLIGITDFRLACAYQGQTCSSHPKSQNSSWASSLGSKLPQTRNILEGMGKCL